MDTLNFGLHPRDTPLTTLNGPGRRFAMWLQGCSVRCTDRCISPDLLPNKPRFVVTVSETVTTLEQRAIRDCGDIEGVTFLGGEPTDQAEPLALLAEAVRRIGWSVVTYSGLTLKILRSSLRPGVSHLLANSDILIDGPYLPGLANPLLRWRGSSNQRIWFLTDRYREADIERLPIEKGTDVTLTSDGRMVVSGLQSQEMLQALERAFRRKGLIE